MKFAHEGVPLHGIIAISLWKGGLGGNLSSERFPSRKTLSSPCEVFFEPAGGECGDFFEGPWFFEEVGGPGYDLEFLFG